MKRSVVIASGVRTPIGDFGGSLAGIPPCELGAAVAREAIARAGIEPDQIEQTVFGNVIHTRPEDMYISRVVAVRAGVPHTSPALTLNRLCGSGLQAVVSAAEQIELGKADIVLAGGAEAMSRCGHLLMQARNGQKMGDVTAIDLTEKTRRFLLQIVAASKALRLISVVWGKASKLFVRKFSICFRSSRSVATGWQGVCPAGNSKCWPLGAR